MGQSKHKCKKCGHFLSQVGKISRPRTTKITYVYICLGCKGSHSWALGERLIASLPEDKE